MVRLLLVEDDADTSRLFAKYLERSGFEVVQAGDGDAGLHAFSQGAFDLVIVDGLLPKKSGFEVTSALRKLPRGKDVGVVMMTAAFKTPQAKKEALAAGVDAFFTKPFVLNDLRAKLGELLQKQGKVLPQKNPAADSVKHVMAAPDDYPLLEPIVKDHKEPLPKDAKVGRPVDVARALLTCARHRLSGLARFTDGASELTIVFYEGVVVGAGDNLREQLLGERLWKQKRLTTEQMRALNARIAEKGERVAEALLALGLCSAEDALGLVADQLKARVRRALLWTGALSVVEDEAEALKRAVEPGELLDVIVGFGVEPAQGDEAARFVAENGAKKLMRTAAFDEGLLALVRVRPETKLPPVVLGGFPTVAEAADKSSTSEVWAAWLAGLVRLPDDPPADVRSLPATIKREAASAMVDREAVAEVCAWLLKARGRTAHELFDMPRDTPALIVSERINDVLALIGPDALAHRKLGPALGAARELWSILDEQRRALERADSDNAALLDAFMEVEVAAPITRPAAGPEDAFLEGQQLLTAGDPATARVFFERAVEEKPGDPEYAAWLGWSEVLTGDEAEGVQRLSAAARDHPQAMRPMFFLGLHAQRQGDNVKAKVLLQECARRSPHDVEVMVALGLVT